MTPYNEMANRRVALGIPAYLAAYDVNTRPIDLLNWERGERTLSNRAASELEALYNAKLGEHLVEVKKAGKTWRDTFVNGFTRDEIRTAWMLEGL